MYWMDQFFKLNSNIIDLVYQNFNLNLDLELNLYLIFFVTVVLIFIGIRLLWKKYEQQSQKNTIKEDVDFDDSIKYIRRNVLGRNKILIQFLNMLESKYSPQNIIAIDAEWGAGKTVFIKEAVYLLTERFKRNEIDPTLIVDSSKIPEDILPVYFDAWKADYFLSPLLALLYTIVKSCGIDWGTHYEFDKRKALNLLDDIAETGSSMVALVHLGILGICINFLLGIASKFIKALNKVDIFSVIKKEETFTSSLKKLFRLILKNDTQRVVIFVDELDRCKPDFAVRLLESVKHYFRSPNIIFVFSINMDELQYVVKNYYGDGFDGYRYLDRFFDVRFQLPAIKRREYFRYLINQDSITHLRDRVMYYMMNHCKMSLREIERYTKMIIIASSEKYYQLGYYPDKKIHALICTISIPILIGLKLTDSKEYNNFIDGKSVDLWCNLINNVLKYEDSKQEWKLFLDKDEYWEGEKKNSDSGKSVNQNDRIKEFYMKLFNTDPDVMDYAIIREGETYDDFIAEIYKSCGTRKEINEVITLLSFASQPIKIGSRMRGDIDVPVTSINK